MTIFCVLQVLKYGTAWLDFTYENVFTHSCCNAKQLFWVNIHLFNKITLVDNDVSLANFKRKPTLFPQYGRQFCFT